MAASATKRVPASERFSACVRRIAAFTVLFGAGVLGALAGDGTGSQSLIDAFSATVGNIGTLIILSGVSR